MNEFEEAAQRISQNGWCKGITTNRSGEMCLLGALDVEKWGPEVTWDDKLDVVISYKNGEWPHLESVQTLATKILEDCERCRSYFDVAIVDQNSRTYGIVWRHNDRHLQSQEDAILLLKEAAHAMPG